MGRCRPSSDTHSVDAAHNVYRCLWEWCGGAVHGSSVVPSGLPSAGASYCIACTAVAEDERNRRDREQTATQRSRWRELVLGRVSWPRRVAPRARPWPARGQRPKYCGVTRTDRHRGPDESRCLPRPGSRSRRQGRLRPIRRGRGSVAAGSGRLLIGTRGCISTTCPCTGLMSFRS